MDAREYIVLTNSASKRALFPSHSLTSEKSDDEDSLGHMSPLRSSSPDRYSSPRQSPCWSEETPVKIPETVSLDRNVSKISQACSNINSAFSECTQEMFTDIIGDTPEKEARNDMLTPFKCLIQRRNIQETPDSTISKNSDVIKKLWKKKEQVANSPEKRENTEKKNFDFNSSIANLIKNSFYRPEHSRAKTSLFPEAVKVKRPAVTVVPKAHPKRHLNATLPGGHFRNTHKRARIVLGEINAGVRHKVKKPKPKLKRTTEIVRQSTEKPLISPEDRVLKCITEHHLLDETNTPSKRRRLEASVNNDANERNCELMSLSSQVQSMNVNHATAKYNENARKSPEIEVVPDPTKKFFKTNRTMAIDHKATVTVVNNVKIQVHNGKLALGNSPARRIVPVKKRPVVLENIFEEDPSSTLDTHAVQKTVQEVLQKLDNEIEMSSELDDTHRMQNITMSTSSLVLHDSEMVNSCKMADDVEKLNVKSTVPKMINSSGLITSEENQNLDNIVAVAETPDESKKMYPVFYKRKGLYDSPDTSVRKASPHIKKMRLIGGDQYQIDAGQSRFRAVNCKECGTLYHVGDPEDEIAHYNIHNNVSTFRFAGWKHEHVIKLYENGERVIVIYPDDPKAWVNKAKDVLSVVDKEMGFVDWASMEIGGNKVYLYVLKNRVVGVLAAEPKNEAYRMINTGVDGPDCCSEETYPVLCGVSRIWTAPDQRRKGVATKLVDSLRLSFMFDHILDKKEIAFSVPTDQGKFFATNYMKTSEFMVYYK